MIGENYFQIERTENTIDEVAVWLYELSEQFHPMVNIVQDLNIKTFSLLRQNCTEDMFKGI
jgi:hypothetical protein